jgi:hypothetical protein
VFIVEHTPRVYTDGMMPDIRAIIGDDEALMPHVVPALRLYNLNQLHIIEHPSTDGSSAHIVSGSGMSQSHIDYYSHFSRPQLSYLEQAGVNVMWMPRENRASNLIMLHWLVSHATAHRDL